MARAIQTLVLALAVHAVCFNILTATASADAGLWKGFYDTSCPKAESIVHDAVKSAVDENPGLAGGLLRLLFHDCFVRGCDASVLIDSTPGNQAEKAGPPNSESLRGFEVLDRAKEQIEAACPGTVSCADIIAFAARDSVALSGGPWYSVDAGRRDGRVSLSGETNGQLPSPRLNAQQLIASFASKGLSQDDMVTLSGAHTIGQAHCRVVNQTRLSPLDPSLDESFAKELQDECPVNGDGNTLIFMDQDSGTSFDNDYYQNLCANKGLFPSDQTLYDDPNTRDTVVSYSKDSDFFSSKFVEAMGKLGAIEVLTGDAGEIRLNCRRIN